MSGPVPENAASPVAWISVLLGAASWVFSSTVPVGLDAAAVILGAIALRSLRGMSWKMRAIPWIGIALGLSKLLFLAGLFLWLALAFSRNPVAH